MAGAKKWGQCGLMEMNRSQPCYLLRTCAECISMQSSFVIPSLSHISIELLQGRTCETASSKHLLTHVRICINIHRLTYMPTPDPLEPKQFVKKKKREKKEKQGKRKRECTVGADTNKMRMKRRREEGEGERMCVCACACVLERGRATWDGETRVDRHWFPQVHVG